jgi:hypothetical protein
VVAALGEVVCGGVSTEPRVVDGRRGVADPPGDEPAMEGSGVGESGVEESGVAIPAEAVLPAGSELVDVGVKLLDDEPGVMVDVVVPSGTAGTGWAGPAEVSSDATFKTRAGWSVTWAVTKVTERQPSVVAAAVATSQVAATSDALRTARHRYWSLAMADLPYSDHYLSNPRVSPWRGCVVLCAPVHMTSQ